MVFDLKNSQKRLLRSIEMLGHHIFMSCSTISHTHISHVPLCPFTSLTGHLWSRNLTLNAILCLLEYFTALLAPANRGRTLRDFAFGWAHLKRPVGKCYHHKWFKIKSSCNLIFGLSIIFRQPCWPLEYFTVIFIDHTLKAWWFIQQSLSQVQDNVRHSSQWD